MDIKQIRYFLSLAETLNFTLAAEKHDISQPALTKAIQRLEEEVGGTLVHRDGKHTRLTELGRNLRSEFEQISNSERRAREIASMHLAQGISHVRLGIANSLGPRLFVDFLGQFAERNPSVSLTLHQVNLATTQEQILSGMLDACFCTLPGKPNHKINTTELFTERLMAAMAPTHPLAEREAITLQDLEQHAYFDRLNCEFRPTFLETVQTFGLDIKSPIQSNREDWVQQLVASGHGITSMAEYSRVVPGIVLRPIEGVDLARRVSLITILGSTACPALREMEKMATHFDWKAALG